MNDSGPYCPTATHRALSSRSLYKFEQGSSLRILQVGSDNGLTETSAHIRTAGEIRLRHTSDDSKVGYMTTDIRVSDPSLDVDIRLDKEGQLLRLVSPKYTNLAPTVAHCISIEITAWVPDDAQFDVVSLQSTELDIRIFDDVNARVFNFTEITSHAGSFYFPHAKAQTSHGLAPTNSANLPELSSLPHSGDIDREDDGSIYSKLRHDSSDDIQFNSRHTTLSTISGSISGALDQYDFLGVRSQSGSISVRVQPHSVLASDPQPAIFEAASVSGSIDVRFPTSARAIPAREYQTSIKCISGSIQGDLLLGDVTSISSHSGSLEVRVLPVGIREMEFSTNTYSGSTDVVVLSPFGSRYRKIASDDPYILNNHKATRTALRSLASTHEGQSGHIHLRYPSEWEGEIQGKTVSGGLKIAGDGVEIISDRTKGWAYREVVARKGPEPSNASLMKIHGVSGSVDVQIG